MARGGSAADRRSPWKRGVKFGGVLAAGPRPLHEATAQASHPVRSRPIPSHGCRRLAADRHPLCPRDVSPLFDGCGNSGPFRGGDNLGQQVNEYQAMILLPVYLMGE